MADLNDQTQNVNIWNDAKTKSVTVTTDGTKERLDVSGAQIEEDRNRLLQGQAYVVNIEYLLNLNQTKYQSFKTPTDKDVYLHYKAYSALRTEIQLWESPTGVVYNFGWTEKQRNRQSSNTAGVVVQDVTSVTTAGTFISKNSLYDAAQTMFSLEYLLKKNTEYLLAMKSYVASNLTTLQINWYEV